MAGGSKSTVIGCHPNGVEADLWQASSHFSLKDDNLIKLDSWSFLLKFLERTHFFIAFTRLIDRRYLANQIATTKTIVFVFICSFI